MNLLPIHNIYVENTELWKNTPNKKWFTDCDLNQAKLEVIASIIFIRIEEYENNYVSLGELDLQKYMGIQDHSLYLETLAHIIKHIKFIRSHGYGGGNPHGYFHGYYLGNDFGKDYEDYSNNIHISHTVGISLEEVILYVLKTMCFNYRKK